MTLTSSVKTTGNLPGDSSTFSFSFDPMVIYDSAELEVYHTVTATGVETLLTKGAGATNYSVSTIPSTGSTGSITYPADEGTAIPSTETITIKMKVDQDQQTAFENRGGYFPKVVERSFDKVVSMVLDLQEQIDRCLKIPISEDGFSTLLISEDGLRVAGRTLQINAAADGIDAIAPSSGVDATASDVVALPVSVSAGSAGSAADASREDHVHLLPTTVPRLATENKFTESQIWFKGSDVSSGATLALGAGNWFDITGTTDITDITSVGAGFVCILHFDGVLTLTHDGDDIICPGGQSIVTHSGMEVMLHEHAAGKWRVIAVMDSVAVNRSQAADLTRKVTFFDDFIGTISTPISSTAGSGGQNEAATISAGAGGRVTLKTDDDIDVDTHAAVCTTLSLDTLDWRADQGGLVLEVRLEIDDVSEAVIFVGFTDAISTTVELPIYKTTGADTIDSDANNACGICYDIDGTTDEWFHGGVKATTDTAAVHAGSAPSDNTAVILRVEVSSAGAVQGFVNGTAIGAAVANAVTTGTPLTPIVVIGNRTANQIIVTLDYIWAQANR